MGCIVNCGFKLLLIVMSIIFVVGGIILAIFGFLSLFAQDSVINLLNLSPSVANYYTQLLLGSVATPSFVTSTSIALASLGFVMVILGFLAWMGGCCGCRLCLLAFSISMIVMLVLVVALLVVVSLQPSKYQSQVSDELYINLDYYTGNGLTMPDGTPEESSNVWDQTLDDLQIQNECCGSTSNTDWNATYPILWDRSYIICTTPSDPSSCTTITNAVVPLSCCKTTNPLAAITSLIFTDPVSCMQTANEAYTNVKGCDTAVNNAVNQFGLVIIPTCVIILIVGVVNVIASCYVFKHATLLPVGPV